MSLQQARKEDGHKTFSNPILSTLSFDAGEQKAEQSVYTKTRSSAQATHGPRGAFAGVLKGSSLPGLGETYMPVRR